MKKNRHLQLILPKIDLAFQLSEDQKQLVINFMVESKLVVEFRLGQVKLKEVEKIVQELRLS